MTDVDADALKRQLAEADARIAQQLGELGFTPEQIQRQLDPSVPDDIKDAEREQVLMAKFAADLDDPSSGLVDAIVASAGPALEADVQKRERERKQQRTRMIAGGAVALAIVAAGVWYFALRDARSTCQRIMGAPAELATLTGVDGKLTYHYDGKYSCSQEFMTPDERTTLVELQYHESRYRSGEDESRYAEVKPITVGGRSGTLYVAGDARERTTDELMADAQSRVGRSRDPIGDALVAGPETRHAAIVPFGDKELRVVFDRRVSPEQAQVYLAAVVARL